MRMRATDVTDDKADIPTFQLVAGFPLENLSVRHYYPNSCRFLPPQKRSSWQLLKRRQIMLKNLELGFFPSCELGKKVPGSMNATFIISLKLKLNVRILDQR